MVLSEDGGSYPEQGPCCTPSVRSSMRAPHLTAIRRNTPSAPARWLRERGLILGRVLDYGCGRGRDADELGCDRYDPHWAPTEPVGPYDTVLCTYVLNVVPAEDEDAIVGRIKTLLSPGGRAYVAVRRDLREWGEGQRLVVLPEPVLHEDSRFCLYVLRP